MKAANLHPSTVNAIVRSVIERRVTTDIQGQRLAALHRLIQAKGSPIETEGEMNGQKALLMPNGDMIAIIHTPTRPGSFYPCKIKSVLLRELTTP